MPSSKKISIFRVPSNKPVDGSVYLRQLDNINKTINSIPVNTKIADNDLYFYLPDSGGDLIFVDKDETSLIVVDSTGSISFSGDLDMQDNQINNVSVVVGGDEAGDNLSLSSTSNATKGSIFFGSNSVYDEANDRLGIGTSSPNDILHLQATVNPAIRLNESADTSSYTKLEHTDPLQTNLDHISNTGNAIFDINARPLDGTGTATVRFFRSTNTTGTKAVQFLKGDGTGTIHARIGVDGGNSYFGIGGGGVGIGTSSPSTAFHISTSSPKIQLTNSDTNADSIINADSSTGSLYIDADANNETIGSVLGLGTDGSRYFYLKGGNVGIGTLSPNSKIHAYSTTGNTNLKVESTAVNSVPRIEIENDVQKWQMRTDGGDSDKFKLYNATADDTPITVTTGGNVGIGVVSPSFPLHVNGAIQLNNYLVWSDGGTSDRDFVSHNDGGIAGLNTRGGIGFFADTSLSTTLTLANACVACEGIYNNSDYLSATTETFYQNRIDWKPLTETYADFITWGTSITRFAFAGSVVSAVLPLRLPKGGTIDRLDIRFEQSVGNTTTLNFRRQSFNDTASTVVASTTFSHTTATTVSLTSLAHTIDADGIYFLQLVGAAATYNVDCYGISVDVQNPVINSTR